jgi:hypothetical protein
MVLQEATGEPFSIPFAEIFSANPFLEELDFSNVNFGDNAVGLSRMQDLASHFSPQLKKFSFENCRVSAEGLKILGSAWGKMAAMQLKEIFLDGNEISDAAIPVLVETLTFIRGGLYGVQCPETLSLKRNNLTKDGALQMIDSIYGVHFGAGRAGPTRFWINNIDFRENNINQSAIDSSKLDELQQKAHVSVTF